MATLWKCRAVDAAAAQLVVRESGGVVAFTGAWTIRSARRSTSSRARPSWPPAPTARWPSWPRCPPPDGRLAPGRARRRGRRRRRRRRAPRWPAARDLDAMAARARERVSAYARLEPAVPPPAAGGRRAPEWARANLETMRGTLEPLLERLGSGPAAVGSAACSSASRPAGSSASWAATSSASTSWRCSIPSARRGCCSWRPTCARPRATFEADEAELLEWVVFHEITHAVQFTGVPWLREHLGRVLRELLVLGRRSRSTRPRCCACPSCRTCARRGTRCATDGLVHAVAGPERKALIDRLQAAMALIEGHAEHVMDAAGADVLPSLPKLRAALERRRREKPAAGQAARAPARPRPQDAPVRGRQALLRRGRRATGGSRASTAPGALRSTCRRSPSSTTRPPGCAEHLFVL